MDGPLYKWFRALWVKHQELWKHVLEPGCGLYIDANDDLAVKHTADLACDEDDGLSVTELAVDHGSLGGLGDDDHTQYVATRPSTTARNTIESQDATIIPLSVQGAASQSADLQRWQSSAPATLAKVDSVGKVFGFGIDATDEKITNVKDGTANDDAATVGQVILESIIDAKGDLIAGTAADTPARVAVGSTNGQVLTVASGATPGMSWADPLTWVCIYNASTSAVAAGAQTQGNHGSTSLVARYLVPAGKSLKIIHVSWGWDTGAGAGTWTIDAIVRVNGATTTVLDTITTGSASSTGADTAEGTLASPLATLAAGDLVQIGWLNRGTSPGPMGTNNKGIYVYGVLV